MVVDMGGGGGVVWAGQRVGINSKVSHVKFNFKIVKFWSLCISDNMEHVLL